MVSLCVGFFIGMYELGIGTLFLFNTPFCITRQQIYCTFNKA